MRGVILVYIFLAAVIWDLAQNDGHVIASTVRGVARTMHGIGMI